MSLASGVERALLLALCLGAPACLAHERPEDAGADAGADATRGDAGLDTSDDAGRDTAVDACAVPQTCERPIPDRPVSAVVDGTSRAYATPRVDVSYAFAQFTQVTLAPLEGTCAPTVQIYADGDPASLGAHPAQVFVEGDAEAVPAGTIRLDAFDGTTWRGTIEIDHPRVRLVLALDVPLCADLSGP